MRTLHWQQFAMATVLNGNEFAVKVVLALKTDR